MVLASRQLHYFIVTAQTLCLTTAAAQLCITPSPLGRSIALLEERLGYRLFIRLPDGIRLTPQGESLYTAVRPLYQQLRQLEKGAALPIHTLKVANDGLSAGFCTVFADKISALSPPQYLQVNIVPVPTMKMVLQQHLADLGIVSDPLGDERGLHKVCLPSDRVKLAVPQELAQHDVVQLMKTLPLAQYHVAPDNGHTRRVLSHLQELGVTPTILRFTEMAQRLRMVQQGLAVSLVPASAIRHMRDGQIQLRDLPGGEIIVNRYVYCLQEKAVSLQDSLALLESSIQQWLNPDEQDSYSNKNCACSSE